ncbi:response regulator [Actinoplanes subtropicus]|uniref:response regulator n=1 Tax=Actinoplanes subtropicus TaxID=543632 RepID=UPI00068FE3F8|nr:response regulator [Actinoplanes subtropicus]
MSTSQAAEAPIRAAPNDGTILLVEDSPDDVVLTKRALRKNNIGNRVIVADDGEQAIEYLLPANGKPIVPELILLDINLPKLSGLDVLRAIRSDERTKYLSVVVLTTSSEEQDIVSSYDLGANSYVRKPVEFDNFLEAVRVLGLYWLLVNQTAAHTRGTAE